MLSNVPGQNLSWLTLYGREIKGLDIETLGLVHVHGLIFRSHIGTAFWAFVKIGFFRRKFFLTFWAGDFYLAHTRSCGIRPTVQLDNLPHAILKA